MFAGASSPGAMLAEIRSAEAVREKRLRTRKERMQRMAGPYAATDASEEYDPENALYEYVCYVLPRAAFANPGVLVKSQRQDMLPKAVARAMQDALKRITSEQRLWKTFRRQCVDYLLDNCVAMVSPEPRPGMVAGGRPVWWPQAYRIDPRCYFEDPLSASVEESRFQGHVMLRDLDSLIAEAEANPDDWHVEAVREIAAETGVELVHPDRHEVPARKQVAIYEVFVPEAHGDGDDPEDGYSGTIYTLGSARGDDPGETEERSEKAWSLRRPRKFYGPKSGPFIVGRFLELESVHLGLSPTLAAEGSMRELAAVGRANNRAARRYKRVVGVVGGDATTNALLNAEDGFSVPLSGEGQLVTAEMGGVSQQGIAHQQMRREGSDRLLGMDDIQRGLVTGDATATEASLAQAGSDARVNDVVSVFRKFVGEVYEALAWYCYHDDRVVVEMEGEVAGMAQPAMRGGPTPGMTFADLRFEIAPYAMESETPATRRMRGMQLLETLGWLAQTVPAAPFLDWGQVLPEIGDLLGVEGLENFVDVEGAAAWAAQMTQYEGKPPTPQVGASLGRNTVGRALGGVNINLGGRGGQGGKKQPSLGQGQGVKTQKLGAA